MKKTIETTLHIRILTGFLLLVLIIILISFSLEWRAHTQPSTVVPQNNKINLHMEN